MPDKTKRLTRSKKDKKIFGVCGGFAQYLGIDSTIVRVILILVVVFTGIFPGVLAYLLAALVMPQE